MSDTFTFKQEWTSNIGVLCIKARRLHGHDDGMGN